MKTQQPYERRDWFRSRLAALQSHDPSAIARAMRELVCVSGIAGPLRGLVILPIVRNMEAAKEVLNQTFRELPGVLEKKDLGTSFMTDESLWLFCREIARLRAMRKRRLLVREARRHVYYGDHDMLHELLQQSSEGLPPASDELRRVAGELLESRLQRLTPFDRKLVELAKGEGLSTKEICLRLNGEYSEEAVRKRIQRAVEVLRAAASRRGEAQ